MFMGVNIMQTIKVDINKTTKDQIDLIVDYLKRGQIIAYPTDTIYGLGCDARREEAVKKINKIKGGRGGKPFLVLISNLKILKQYCHVNKEQEEYLKDLWLRPPLASPGMGEGLKSPLPPLLRGMAGKPVTVILENRNNLPEELTGGRKTLAVRLPKNEFLIRMISGAGFPVVSTSLNKTGESPLDNAQNLEKYFEHPPDLAIDAGECRDTKPSSLLDLRDVRNIKVIRE